MAGINIASGFDLKAKQPLDQRLIVKTIAERKALEAWAYPGMMVYVEEDEMLYVRIYESWYLLTPGYNTDNFMLNVDLNTITSRGVYCIGRDSEANDLNYPDSGLAGSLYVSPSDAGLIQLYISETHNVYVRCGGGNDFTKAPWQRLANETDLDEIRNYVDSEISQGIAASDAMIFKGTLGTGGTVTSLPTTHKTGWTYRVIIAGTYAGQKCEVGDLIIALADRNGTGNTNNDWTVAQTNIDGTKRIDGVTFNTNGDVKHFGVCDTAKATATKTVTIEGWNLVDGAVAHIRFVNGIPAAQNVTLNINSTGAKSISTNGIDDMTSVYNAVDTNQVLSVIYDADNDRYALLGAQLSTESFYSQVANKVNSYNWTTKSSPSGAKYIALVDDCQQDTGIPGNMGAMIGLEIDSNGRITADITGNAETATSVNWSGIIDKPDITTVTVSATEPKSAPTGSIWFKVE